MIKFTLVRLFQAVLTLLAASFVVFALARVTGSPADTMLPMDATPAEREAMIKRLGLDLPLVQQYWLYLQDAARGDFGVSLRFLVEYSHHGRLPEVKQQIIEMTLNGSGIRRHCTCAAHQPHNRH